MQYQLFLEYKYKETNRNKKKENSRVNKRLRNLMMRALDIDRESEE